LIVVANGNKSADNDVLCLDTDSYLVICLDLNILENTLLCLPLQQSLADALQVNRIAILLYRQSCIGSNP